jgi:choline dehydrogenase-like flavoprotein
VESVDVVIVGSGYGGAITAARLAEAGMSVVVLERGPRREPEDLVQSDDPRDIVDVVDLVVTRENVGYRTGKLVGGASIAMDGAHFRVPQRSFEVITEDGFRAWPEQYSRAMLDPYYDRAEQMLRVRQFPWSEIPRAGGLFAKMLDGAGASCDRARMNYADCLQCGFCAQGCIFDKKVTVLQTYIPLAEQHGAEFRAGANAQRIEPSGTGYVVHYTRDGEAAEVFGQRLIVACGGVYSPGVLLRSADRLPGLSAQLGENFNTNGEHAFIGILPPEFDDLDRYHCFQGMDNAGMMSFHWFESDGFTLHPGAGLEPSIFAADVSAPDHPVLPSRAWGLEHKRFVEQVYPHRLIGFSALGLVEGHRAVVVDDEGVVNTAKRDRKPLEAYLDRLDAVIDDVGRQTGVTLVPAVPREMFGTTAAHLLSACRMADSPDTGVVDADCQVFDHENMYVCDASSVPYSLGVNPALTISALAERTAERIVARG